MRTNLVDASVQSRLAGLQLLAGRGGTNRHIDKMVPTPNPSTRERYGYSFSFVSILI